MNFERVISYDIELSTPILDREPDDPPPYDYAVGWKDYQRMKIACLASPTVAECLGNVTGKNLYRTSIYFSGQNLRNAEFYLNQYDLLISFNGLAFDQNVMRANGIFSNVAEYDLLHEWKKATGKRVSLGDLSCANLAGVGKSGNGADAPMKWIRGQYQEVIEYNFDDTILVARLFALVLKNGQLINPRDGKLVRLPEPNT